MGKRKMEICKAVMILALGIPLVVFMANYFTASKESAFEPLPKTSQDKLTWIFVTRNGDGEADYPRLVSGGDQLEAVMGVPVKTIYCTADKFLNMSAADMPMDIVTSCYMDSKIKRFETSGKFLRLQDLIREKIPGFELPPELVEWCGNMKGDVYAYPHTRTIIETDNRSGPGVVMLAQKDLLQKYQIDKSSFDSKEGTLAALKTIRKKESGIVSSYFDLISLQQMFGARTTEENGQWQEPFFQEETLEAIQYMNQLYRERVLSQEVFALTDDRMLSHLVKGDFFLAATRNLYELYNMLPENDPIWEQYEIVGPIAPESGKAFSFTENYNEQFASTMFLADSRYRDEMANLFAHFYMQNMELSPSQEAAFRKVGIEISHKPEEGGSETGGNERYQRFAVPVIHYEILFSHYADTRLAEINERMMNYKDSQVVKMVLNLEPNEVERVYRETVQEIQNDDYDLVLRWKRGKYQRALEISEQVPEQE